MLWRPITRNPERLPSRLEISSVIPSAKYASLALPRFSKGTTASVGVLSATREVLSSPAAAGVFCLYKYQPDNPTRSTSTPAPTAMDRERFGALDGRAGNIPVGEV